MSTELTKSNDLKSLINSDTMREQFARALPKHLTADRFCRVAITALSRTPKLQNCSPESFMKCLLDLSAMGLEPDGRRAHLIPYGKEATLVVDYKGLVELVRRSGDVAKIHADVVCENDQFQHSMGEVQVHTYDLRKPRGEAYAAYAQVTLKDGSVQAAIIQKADILATRDKSSGWQAFVKKYVKTSPWDPADPQSEMEMWKKTAFRRLTKWLTLSPEIQERIAAVDSHEFQPMRNVTPVQEEPQKLTNPFSKAVPSGTAEEVAQTEQAKPGLETKSVPSGEAASESFVLDDSPGPFLAYYESHKTQESKQGADKPWKLWRLSYGSSGKCLEAVTFSETHGELIEDLQDGEEILIEIEETKKGDTIKTIQRA